MAAKIYFVLCSPEKMIMSRFGIVEKSSVSTLLEPELVGTLRSWTCAPPRFGLCSSSGAFTGSMLTSCGAMLKQKRCNSQVGSLN